MSALATLQALPPMNEISWSSQASLPLLFLLQTVPAVGALLLWRMGESRSAILVGRLLAGVVMLLAIALYLVTDINSASLQMSERLPFIGYHVAADGITVLFVLVGAFIVLLTALYGLVRGLSSTGRLLATVLAVESALMVNLLTINLLWFAAASAVELFLIGHLIAHWATSTEENRNLAISRFLQFQIFGWCLLVAGFVVVAWNYADATGGQWSFDLVDLAGHPPPGKFQTVAFFLMFYGLAVRTPLFPLHGWLPPVVHRGTVAVAPGLLLGVKVGIYGIIRFVLPLTPDAVVDWQYYIVGFAMFGVFFTAILAFLQTNLRRLLSFAVVSHTSLIVIGLFTLDPVGIQGAIMLSVNFGLAVTVMLFMVGFVFRRTGTTDLDRLGGLFERIPFLSFVFFVGGISVIGMPGTPGFDAAHLVLEAAIAQFGALPTIATALGNVVAAGFLLWAFQRSFLAPAAAGAKNVERTLPMETLVASVALSALLITGFYSEPWLRLTDAATQAIGNTFGNSGGH